MLANEVKTDQAEPTRLQMSYPEFLAWADENTHAEWVNGEVLVFMPPTFQHQSVLGFLQELLRLFVNFSDLGTVLFAPFEMKLAHSQSYREPDILFVAKENLERLTDERLVGPADLIVEIVSAGTVRNDREDKLKEYQAAGVPEYWIIDPRPAKQRADFYHLAESGLYELFATEDDERVESRLLPGFWLRPEWLWQAESLQPLDIFFEIRGLSDDQIAQIRRMLGD